MSKEELKPQDALEIERLTEAMALLKKKRRNVRGGWCHNCLEQQQATIPVKGKRVCLECLVDPHERRKTNEMDGESAKTA